MDIAECSIKEQSETDHEYKHYLSSALKLDKDSILKKIAREPAVPTDQWIRSG